MNRTIVTGANGFVGRHLIRELANRNHEIIAIGFGGDIEPELNALVSDYLKCDLSDPEAVAGINLDGVTGIINLAGLANVGASFDDPEKYQRINVAMLTTLAERLLETGSTARILAISTGAVYDNNQDLPLTEESKTITEGSPYALSKLSMEEAAHELGAQGLNYAIARPFNHAGPGQAPGFLIPDLYTKILAAKESGESLKVGNLDTKRDYTDVRDVVRAYVDLIEAEKLEHTVYNICSGTSRSGREILDLFVKNMDLGDTLQTEVDESLIRPSDPPILYGSYSRLNEQTGWQPVIPFEQTIADVVNQ
jgi:GDP-4-dehydro-6-deoxy-D-mannose reductase